MATPARSTQDAPRLRGGFAPERRLVLSAGAAAALPVLVATVRVLQSGFVPLSDQAVAATRAYDVFTSWTPLVGPWSSSSSTVGEATHHLGPLLYWLLAVPTRLPGEAFFPITMGAVNAACIMGTVALAHRRGGRLLMFLAAAAVALMCSALETQVLADIWNPSAPVLPFTLLIFVGWSVACGDHRLLPLAVLLASFVAQCHLAYLLPAAGIVGIGMLGLISTRLRGSRAGVDDRSLRRWALAALLVALACWSGPLLDQGLAWSGSDRGSGNLATVVAAAQSRETPVGAGGGARAVARAVGIPAWWVRGPQAPLKRTFDIFGRLPLLTLVTSVAVVAVLVGLVLLGLRHRGSEFAVPAALALVLCASLAAVTASFPNTPTTIFSYSYTSWWAAPVGMFAWLVLAWRAATLWPSRPSAHRRRPAFPAVLALGVVVAVAVAVAVNQEPPAQRDDFERTRAVVRRLDAALPHPGVVRVDSSLFDFQQAVIYSLRRRGATVQAGVVGVEFGQAYERRDRRAMHVVDIRAGTAIPRNAQVVARVRVASPGRGVITVSLRPGERAR